MPFARNFKNGRKQILAYTVEKGIYGQKNQNDKK